MNKTIPISVYFVRILVTVLFVFLFFIPTTKASSDSYGWFATRADHVGVINPTLGCSASEASMEIALVNIGTTNQVTSSIPSWTLMIDRDGDEVVDETYVQSGALSASYCLNPNIAGVKVIVQGNSSYHNYTSPTVYLDNNDDTLKGNHFRGYIELRPKTNNTPNITTNTSFPGPIFNSNTLTFVTNFNDTSSVYGNNGVRNISFYLKNTSVAGATTLEQSISLLNPKAASLSYSPVSILAQDGHYLWTYHAELNNSKTSSSGATNWTFSNIPVSSVPADSILTYDSSAPETKVSSFEVVDVRNLSTNPVADVKAFLKIDDIYSGIQMFSLFVRDTSTGGVVHSNNFTPPTTFTSTWANDYVVPDLKPGKTYEFYLIAVDNASNDNSLDPSIYYTYTVPSGAELPQISITDSNEGFTTVQNDLNLKISLNNKYTNILPVNSVYICYSIGSSAAIDALTDLSTTFDLNNDGVIDDISASHAGVSCFDESGDDISDLNDSDQDEFIERYLSNLNFAETYYFKAFAHNALGWGHSNTWNETTINDPFNDPFATQFDIDYITPVNTNYIMRGIDFLRPGIRVNSTLGSPLKTFGICRFDNASDRNTLETNFSTAVNIAGNEGVIQTDLSPYDCVLKPPLKDGTAWSNNIPPFESFGTFNSLLQNKEYYFLVFAVNQNNDFRLASGQAETNEVYYHFKHFIHSTNPSLSSLGVFTASNFNEPTNTFGTFKTKIIAHDTSYDPHNPLDPDDDTFVGEQNGLNRFVGYNAKLYVGSGYSTLHDTITVQSTETGALEASQLYVTPNPPANLYKDLIFTNVPVGPFKIVVELVPPASFDCNPSDSSCISDRSWELTGLLNQPDSGNTNTAANNNSSGAAGDPDPEIQLEADPSLVRKGNETKLKWSIKDIPGTSFTCKIYGVFPSGSPVIINPTPTGATIRIEGTEISDELSATQNFFFTCENDATGTIWAIPDPGVRVNVIGSSEET